MLGDKKELEEVKEMIKHLFIYFLQKGGENMARSKFVWLLVFEGGETQFVKAQNVGQILYNDGLIENSDSIINITRMELASSYNYQDVLDIPFQD